MFSSMLANLPFRLPIADVGNASSIFTDVFLAPQLSMNLIYVGQLVDNNCVVNFSSDDCVVQDKVMGETIVKGPKVGRLFTLFLPIPALSPVSSLSLLLVIMFLI